MSNEVNNLAHSFVAMAQAYERLPLVQADLDKAMGQIEDYAKQVQRLEMRLIDRANELTTLGLTLAGVEAERDEATRAFLEADAATQRALDVIKTFMGNAGNLLQALEPPKPVDVPEVATEPVVQDQAGVTEGQSEPHPTSFDGASTEVAGSEVNTSSFDDGGPYNEPLGQSATDPIAAEWSTDSGNDVTSTSASPTENASQPTMIDYSKPEGVSVPSDPTASSTAGDGHSLETVEATTTADNGADASSQTPTPTQPSEDDVGYHNEPEISAGQWAEWDAWCHRMNARYGQGHWPSRSAFATAAQ